MSMERNNEEMNIGQPGDMTAELLSAYVSGLNDKQIEQFINYYNVLIERNRVMNLTRITSPIEAAQKHFADSILGAELLPENARVIDVGTGAGFPGIPLKIVRPDIELVLLDSLAKRIGFLEEACAKIGIGARAIHARAEDAARSDGLRAHFDAALSRAVAPMNLLLELTVPFLKVGGRSLMYKGAGAAEEIAACPNACRELCCSLTTRDYDVPWGERTIVIAEKLSKTPSRYPRKAGVPQKKPL